MIASENDVSADAVIKLKYPVEWGKEGLIDEIYIRRAKFKDIRAVKDVKNEMDAMAKMMTRITGLPGAFIDEMDAEDIMEAGKIIEGFMPKSPKDGKDGLEPSQDI